MKRKVYRSASLSAGKSENEIQQIKASENITPHKYLRLSNFVSHFSPAGTRLMNCAFAKAVATFANSYTPAKFCSTNWRCSRTVLEHLELF